MIVETVNIGKLDNTKPTITKANKQLNEASLTLTVEANDINKTLNASGSGVTGYALTNSKSIPNSFQESNNFTITNNGTYYVWSKDLVGNISEPVEVIVNELKIDIDGTITDETKFLRKYAPKYLKEECIYPSNEDIMKHEMERNHFTTLDDLYAAIGYGGIPASKMVSKMRVTVAVETLNLLEISRILSAVLSASAIA